MKAFVIVICFVNLVSTWAKDSPFVAKPFSIHDKPQQKFSHAKGSFEKVKKLLLENYIDKKVTEEDLYLLATQGMLNGLNKSDKNWNQLLTPNQVENMNISLKGRFKGVGLALKYIEESGTAVVIAFPPDSVAKKSGIEKGDTILSVDGKVFKGKPFSEMVDQIRGPEGQAVTLQILRGDKVFTKKIVRKEIRFPQVSGRVLDGNIGFLSISHFSKSSVNEITKELHKLKKSKIKSLIVDLRGNMGGIFESSIATADMLLEKGKVITVARSKNGGAQIFKSKDAPIIDDVQIVVLTSDNTSSGAELLTMALKEGRSAKIVGQKTSGKWNAQQVVNLSNKYAAKFTVKSFETASGKSFEDIGITPDLEISDQGYMEVDVENSADLTADAGIRAALSIIK